MTRDYYMQDRRINPGLSRWLTILILILILVISLVAIGYISSETKKALTESTRSELAALAALSASQINGSMLDDLEAGDEHTPEFLAIRDQLFLLEQSHPDIKYIYTMRKVNDTIQFVVDAEYGMGTPGDTPVIGEVYTEVSPEMNQGFTLNTAEHEFVTDEWGTTLSGYAPVRDSAGHIVGIVGVDMSAERVMERISFLNDVFLLFLFAVFLLLLIIGVGSEFARGRYDSAIQESEKRYHAVVDAQTEFIVRFRPDGTLLFANEAYCKYYGKECSEMIGNRMVSAVPPEDRKQLVHHLTTLSPDHPVASIEHRTILPDGRIGWHQWTDRAFFDQDNRPVEYQSIGRDITEKKQIEEALRQGTKKLNLLNYIIFTDIRNALFILSGYFQLEKEIPANETMRHYQDQQEALIQRIEKSLDSAKDYQSLGLNPPIWQNVYHIFLYAISHLDIAHLSRKTPVEHIEIFADSLLEKVFYHLVQNVIVHAKTATEISLTSNESDRGLTLFFSDNGVGIPDELKEGLFNQDFSNKKFGLFLSREILSITGISISETGEPGKGAQFEIHVPKGTYRFVTPVDTPAPEPDTAKNQTTGSRDTRSRFS
jgi:PAS domain S-box-containing protein